MPTPPARSLEERALALSEAVGRLPGVVGVCIVGSVARGDAHAGSDIDVLVLGDDEELGPRRIRELLPDRMQASASFSAHDVEDLDDYLGVWTRSLLISGARVG